MVRLNDIRLSKNRYSKSYRLTHKGEETGLARPSARHVNRLLRSDVDVHGDLIRQLKPFAVTVNPHEHV